jgi:hypothetical protein
LVTEFTIYSPRRKEWRWEYHLLFWTLVEELSTIEQMKKSYYRLYKKRKCVYRNRESETFDHIWGCSQRIEELNDLYVLHNEILCQKLMDF